MTQQYFLLLRHGAQTLSVSFTGIKSAVVTKKHRDLRNEVSFLLKKYATPVASQTGLAGVVEFRVV